MKQYRIVLLDFNRPGNYKIVWTKYADGIREARNLAPIKCHFSRNAKCFTGLKNNLTVFISEI